MKEKLKKLHAFSNSWTGTIIIVLLIIFFLAQAFVIPSGSMKNSLLIGDHVLVKKFAYGVPIPHLPWVEIPLLPDWDGDGHLLEGEKPKRGEIVVFRYPENPDLHYVKRCVAVGGDIVGVMHKDLYLHPHEGNDYVKETYPPGMVVEIEGLLWVKNPYMHDHPGIHHDDQVDEERFGTMLEPIFSMMPIQVPEGHYYMMGDNRDHSNDSRFWGPVPYKNIVGKPWRIYWSWESRSYDEVLKTAGYMDFDVEELHQVCGDTPIRSEACQKIWDRHRFSVRWDRIGRSVAELEEASR